MLFRRTALHPLLHSVPTAASLLFAAAAHAGPLASAAPLPQAASAGSLFQVLMGLVLVLGLLAGAAWLLKRFNLAKAGAGTASVRVIGGVTVGSRDRVMVVEVADQG